MRLLLRLALRDVSRRFIQSALFVVGVALGVAMMVAIDVANGSATRAFNLSTTSITGKATHQVTGGPGGLSSEVYRALRVDLGLHESAPVVTEIVRAVGAEEPLRVLGVDPFAEPPFRTYLNAIEIESGSNAQGQAFDAVTAFIAQPGTAFISQTLAERLGIGIGGTLTVQAGIVTRDIRVVGILKPTDKASTQALDDLILTDISTAQDILHAEGRLTRIDLILPPERTAELEAVIRAILPNGAVLQPSSDAGGALSQMTAAFELNLQALSLLALVVGVFLIYNTVTFNVVQRRASLGILRALGATREQGFGSIVGEAVLLGAVGTVGGLGLGIIFGRGAVGLVAQTISNLYFTVSVQGISVESFTLIKGAFIGIAASVVAAAIPAYDATRTPPAGTMRRSDQEDSIRRLLPMITGAAALLIGLGAVLLMLPTTNLFISFGALFCVVVGGALFTPIALVLMMRVIEPILSRWFGILGRMAPRAVERSLSRTAVAVAALTIAISVIVGVSVMISSFRNTVADWLETTLGADIYISSPLQSTNRATVDIDPVVRQLVADTPGVVRVSTGRSVNVIAPEYPDLPPVNLQAIESDIAPNRGYVWQTVPDVIAALGEGKVMVSEPFAFRRGITPDHHSLTLLTDEGERTFDIVAVFYDYTTDQGQVIMMQSLYYTLWDDPYITATAAFIQDDADLTTVVDAIRERVAGYDLTVQANRELRTGVFEVFDNTFAITIALRLLATIVAFIGILSALLALQLENTRQYGVMRAVGMTPFQLWRFTLLQTGLMGGVAGLLALPIGLALAMVLLFVINVRSFGWTMQFYFIPNEFIQAFTVAVIASMAAGLYPAYRITRLAVARALRSE